ncbi:MAG: hypothetical protein QOG48_277, partial [Verrucomicrobiota bacterium]
QYIAYEPVMASLTITNLARRDVDLHDVGEQAWFGFEVTGQDGQTISRLKTDATQPPLQIEAGKRVTQKINLTPLYDVHDFGTYHVRAHIYFTDLDKFFYSPARVFEVMDARPIWQRTVGMPDESSGPGKVRTYSLMTNRFPEHTSLYVRVADQDRGIVYSTYSLGRIIAFDGPHAEVDRNNILHVLHCAAPRTWSYSKVGLNGELVSHSTFMETKTRPRLARDTNGLVAVRGGMIDQPVARSTSTNAPKLSDRPNEPE